MKKSLIVAVSVLLILLTMSSCNKLEEPPLEPVSGSIVFYFDHVVGDKSLEYNKIDYTNAFGNLYSVETLKYFISDIVLKRKDGQEVYFDMEHYVDGLDKNTHVFKPGTTVPRGEYVSVSFIFGLSKEKNINGAFPNPPENNMEWPIPLGGGYHYMKLEGKIDNPGGINTFQAHTGPTDGNQNFIKVVLPKSGFTLAEKELSLYIKMDINRWWETPNVFDLNTMTMVMGNQEVQQKLHDNGMDVFSLTIK
jgi:hypothetical protein